jgi:hypothetical protein
MGSIPGLDCLMRMTPEGFGLSRPAAGRAACLFRRLALLLLCAMPDGSAWARQQASATMMFDIPAEPLGDALGAYSSATGMAAFTSAGLVAGKRSAAVKGAYTQAGALAQLLQNTGLQPSYIDSGSFTLVPAAPAAPPPPAPQDAGQFAAYAAIVQQALIQKLCANAETSLGSYRAALAFWIGPAGDVEHPVLVESSGDAARDSMILALIDGANIGMEPPVDLPQPASILIVPQAPGVQACPPEAAP